MKNADNYSGSKFRGSQFTVDLPAQNQPQTGEYEEHDEFATANNLEL